MGKNIHFIFKLCLEGRDILRWGDASAESLPFTSNDIQGLRTAHTVSWKAIKAQEMTEADRLVVQEMPALMSKMAAYYEKKIKALETSASMIYPIMNQDLKYWHYFRKGDFDSLLDYYPQTASLLYDGGHTEVPAVQAGASSLIRKKMAIRLREAFKCQQDIVGRPDIFADARQEINLLRSKARRHSAVLEAIQSVVAEMDEIISPKPKEPAKLYAFPALR